MTYAEQFANYLESQGFRPEIDQDGDVAFKHEGRNYFISVYENDRKFFSLVFPGFWRIESRDELLKALIAATRTSASIKSAKVWLTKDLGNVCASVECFLEAEDDFKAFFLRALRALQQAVSAFVERMKEE